MTSRYRLGASPIHGVGVFSRTAFCRGDRIGILRGRVAKRAPRSADTLYVIELDAGGFLRPLSDPPVGLWRLNHSCRPNAVLVNKRRCVYAVALRRISPGEEITCDYRPSFHEGQLPCACGEARCSGRI